MGVWNQASCVDEVAHAWEWIRNKAQKPPVSCVDEVAHAWECGPSKLRGCGGTCMGVWNKGLGHKVSCRGWHTQKIW